MRTETATLETLFPLSHISAHPLLCIYSSPPHSYMKRTPTKLSSPQTGMEQ